MFQKNVSHISLEVTSPLFLMVHPLLHGSVPNLEKKTFGLECRPPKSLGSWIFLLLFFGYPPVIKHGYLENHHTDAFPCFSYENAQLVPGFPSHVWWHRRLETTESPLSPLRFCFLPANPSLKSGWGWAGMGVEFWQIEFAIGYNMI